jgi:diaminopimelate epimerase
MTKSVSFTKMHGLGNDYILVQRKDVEHADLPAMARAVSDRHRGIGSDGLIVLYEPEESTRADLRMRIFNADGSEAEMCGNGIRCVGKLAYESRLVEAPQMCIQSAAGIHELKIDVDQCNCVRQVAVNMGCAVHDLQRLPVDPQHVLSEEDGRLIVNANGTRVSCHVVRVGNPHAVIIVDDVEAIDLRILGPSVETHPAFPQGINVHVAAIVDRNHIAMRSWERGVGCTQACGTGACAVGAVLMRKAACDGQVEVTLPGGELQITRDAGGDAIWMRGPATMVCHGHWHQAPPPRS